MFIHYKIHSDNNTLKCVSVKEIQFTILLTDLQDNEDMFLAEQQTGFSALTSNHAQIQLQLPTDKKEIRKYKAAGM